IAHDFNNILMGIMGYTSLLITQVDPEVPYYAKLKNIEQHVRSGANLTKQLLGFARGGNADIKPANVNTIVEKTIGMFGRSRREVTIAVELAGTWTIEADSGQIEQVLLNLYLNAWQAMENGGKLFLATGNAAVDPLQAERLNIAAGSYVFVSVRDTGCGMDDETLQRIFDPFFTTKEPGTGTGLGLASTYGIVKNHLGGINVESSPGQGTTFTLYLPASEKSIAAEEELPAEIAGGTGTIMLVDDEEAMLEVGVEILETLGYKVFSAGSGDKALEIFGHQSDNIDLVIVDMIMPGMGGGELFDRLRAAKPLVKVLLASGYSLDGDAGKIMERGCNGFLQKPFGLKELSHKLKEILTGY
ncbi:MAG: response regulator, partial [Deltaproteobacteria bacterium]|nr:response regulator [Deltaproteobacteria bacterium]